MRDTPGAQPTPSGAPGLSSSITPAPGLRIREGMESMEGTESKCQWLEMDKKELPAPSPPKKKPSGHGGGALLCAGPCSSPGSERLFHGRQPPCGPSAHPLAAVPSLLSPAVDSTTQPGGSSPTHPLLTSSSSWGGFPVPFGIAKAGGAEGCHLLWRHSQPLFTSAMPAAGLSAPAGTGGRSSSHLALLGSVVWFAFSWKRAG